MLLNAKLNDTAQKIMWVKAVNICERIRNSMATAGISISPSENSYREKPKIVASFSEFGRAGYVTKREKSKKKMTGKKLKSIMVGYADNHTRDTKKL